MTEKPTDNSRYKSPSTGEYCTCAQYIAELACQRMAEKNNEGSLSYKFWNSEKWNSVYKQQVFVAHGLVKKYTEAAIIKALNSSRGKRIYSLRFPGLEELIKIEQDKIELQEQKSSNIIYDTDISDKRRKPFGKKSPAQRLRDLDGEKNK